MDATTRLNLPSVSLVNFGTRKCTMTSPDTAKTRLRDTRINFRAGYNDARFDRDNGNPPWYDADATESYKIGYLTGWNKTTR